MQSSEDIDDIESSSIDSADALCEMLGISTNAINCFQESSEEGNRASNASNFQDGDNADSSPVLTDDEICDIVSSENLAQIYKDESICLLPRELSVPQNLMRRLTTELVYGETRYPSDRSYEKISFIPRGGGGVGGCGGTENNIQERRELTRFENFVNGHQGWQDLCNGHLAKCISAIVGEEMVLFKEKLNLKPPGGSGFAPHLDSPSLRISFGDDGPSTFVTVMVAIDDMTTKNGCLKVCKGPWNECNHVETIKPQDDGNPDAGGRAGAIEDEVAEQQLFEPITCKGGDIAAFNGFAPHRSSSNTSPFPRRAVFLTYNAAREGNYHDRYYDKMKELRDDWLKKMKSMRYADHEAEIEALNSIPRT